MSIALGAFAEGFAGARQSRLDRSERQANSARQDRWLDIMEKNPGMISGMGGGGMAMGALPGMPGGGGGGGNAAAARMPTSTNAAYVREGLIKRGMQPHAADGFVMNFQDESGFNTSVLGDNGAAYGLAQWNGPRQRALRDFAAEKGMDVSNADLQMDYLMHELQGPESKAWGKIQGANTPGAAAAAVLNYFERPAESHRARREKSYLAFDARPAMGARAPAY